MELKLTYFSTKKITGILAWLLVSSQLTACSSSPLFHKRSYSDNLFIDTNAVEIYPNNIQIYNLNNLPNKPYKVVDNFKVSIYNQYGSKLQRAKINTYLQDEAARLGGDGVIDLGVRDNNVYAEAIKFVAIDKLGNT